MIEKKHVVNLNPKCIILFSFFCLIFLIHIPWVYMNDDQVILPLASQLSLQERFWNLYTYNGKICTDLAAFLIYQIPFTLWKALDSAIYVVIASLLSFLFTRNTHIDLLTVCALLLLFPFYYLNTAGYICVTTNYVYTTLCLLLIMVPLKYAREHKSIHPLWHLLVLAASFYATNQDQSAMVLIGGLLLYDVYLICVKSDRRIIITVSAYLAFAISCYLFMFFMPGHVNRMTSTAEMELYLPEYANWSFFKKIYQGYTSTVAHIMFENVDIFIVFCIFLFLLSLTQKKLINVLIGFTPLGVLLLEQCLGSSYFIYAVYYPVMELYPLGSGLKAIWGLGCSLLILFCIFHTIFCCTKKKENKWLLAFLLILAAGSRELMGFSPTIYASSYRTFTYFIYALIICCLILLDELKAEREKTYWISGTVAVIVALLL